MRRPKVIFAAVVMGAAAVLPAATPAQAASCSMGVNPTSFNTCIPPVPCNPGTVTVKVTMTGTGTVFGFAGCGSTAANLASCAASGPPSGSCVATAVAEGGLVLRCYANLSGVVLTWQVTCAS